MQSTLILTLVDQVNTLVRTTARPTAITGLDLPMAKIVTTQPLHGGAGFTTPSYHIRTLL